MSCEGGLVGQKHGGPHGTPHESRLDVNIDINDTFTIKSKDISKNGPQNESDRIQDGVGEIDGKSVVEENLNFLSGDDDLDSYERAVVENNAEWLKSRCRNLETVDFDIPSSSQDDAGVGDLFGSDPLPDDTGLPLPDGATLVNVDNDGVLQFTRQLCDGQPSSLCASTISNLQKVIASSRDDLYELTTTDLHLGGKELQALGLKIDSDKNNTLMTPQELESMPDRGIEFEESVGPKSDSVDLMCLKETAKNNSNSCITTQTCNDSLISQSSHKSVIEQSPVQLTANAVRPVLLQQSEVVPQVLSSSSISSLPHTPNTSVDQTSGSESAISQGNLKLATISISTDKASNSTQILVNTNQGQQLYHINTADLQQATNALEPLSRPTLPEGHIVENIPASPIQTGYLILPTSQYESLNLQNGIQLVPSSLESIGGQMIQQIPQIQLQSFDGRFGSNTTPRKVYMCSEPGCEKIFRKLSKFKIHQMRHTGERPFKCTKPGCDWAFTTLYKLKRHAESHQGKKDFICDWEGCGKKFTTVYNLNSHRRLHDRPLCEECPEEGCIERFPTKRQLDLHMKNHVGLEKTYKCPVEGCDKTFFSPHCMGSHPRVHSQEREDLTCKFEGCGKVFDKICRLKQHMRSHTGEKPFKCRFENCGWAFATASKLKRHQAKHTGLRKWMCKQCGKGFMRAEHLKGHLMTHSGEKPYACPVEGCTVKFTAKSSLYVHMKKHDHSGEKITYHCPMDGCEKKYNSKVTLRQHIVKQHIAAGSELANMDLTSLLTGDLISGPEESSQETNVVVQQGSNINSALQRGCLESPDTIYIDPSEFITPVVGNGSVITTATEESGVQQISPELISQILSSVEQQSDVVTETNTEGEKQPQIITIPALSQSGLDAGATKGKQDKGGSARTDYHSNRLLSDRAKKRRQLLKDKISVSLDSSSFQDSSEHGNFVVPTSYSSSDSMTSRGITFRDPETGVLYVQTQLLQDDPPNLDLFTDHDVGSSDVSSIQDSSGSGSELGENSLQNVEFSTSTINLQDLE